MSPRLLIAAALAALALGLAACGDDDDSSSDDGAATEVSAQPAADNTNLKQKPVVETTGDESPGALVVEDIVVGKGPEGQDRR